MQRDLFDSELSERDIDTKTAEDANVLQTFRLHLGVDQLIFVAILLLVYTVFIYGLGVTTAKNINFRGVWKGWISRISQPQTPKRVTTPVQKKMESALPVVSNPVPAAVPPPAPALPSIKLAAPQPKSAETPIENAQESSSGKKKYTIQIIASKQLDFAHKKSDKLAKLGLESFVLKEKNYHNVCVRSFMSKSQAEKFLTQLKSQGLAPRDAYVRNLS